MNLDEPDLDAGSWIRVQQEWRLLSGERPVPRIEGSAALYGCDTGCAGWVVYLFHEDGREEQLSGFEFTRGRAIKAAEEESEKRGNLPIVMEKSLY